MNPLDVFLSEFNSKSHPRDFEIQVPSLHQKWIEENCTISWVWSFCCESFYLIPFSFNKTLFLPCQNILTSLSHFLSSSSVSLCISLLIICGRKPLMFPCPWISLICRSFLLNAVFLLLLWTVLLLDSLIAAMPVYVTDQKWWKEKNAKKERSKIPRSLVWQRFKASYLISHNLPSVTNVSLQFTFKWC